MHQFRYKDNKLMCEGVGLADVAAECGTPTYVYSAGTIAANYRRMLRALEGLDVSICFAVKANSNLAVLRHLANLGAGFDLVSGGEIRRTTAADGSLKKSVFAGVGKSPHEIELALKEGVFSFHVESEAELDRINAVAGRLQKKAPVGIRVNPDIDAQTHAKITTGTSGNKFGVPIAGALDACNYARSLPNISLQGLQIHIGSQVTTTEPFVEAVKKTVPLVSRIKEKFGLSYFSIGGGIGIPYEDALASGEEDWWKEENGGSGFITPESYGCALAPLLQPLGLKILLEPGRLLVGNAGVLLTRVELVKRGQDKSFVIVDAAMNDLLRPAMYDAYHQIIPVERKEDLGTFTPDIVGTVCETADTFARNRKLQRVREGDLLALMSAGAYGFVMASRYNTRPLPAEVLVMEDRFSIVHPRETFENILRREMIPDFLATAAAPDKL